MELEKEWTMKELLQSNNLVQISQVTALLNHANIEIHVFDTHASNLYGLANAIPQRIMVRSEDYEAAQQILKENNIIE